MSDIVVKAENLGKKYVIGHQAANTRYVALRDVLTRNARSIWHKTRDLLQGRPIIPGANLEEVWALRDVSFEIRRGEVVGIIGRNGAGKSTLLKILSRITEPTEGRVRIRGRVASLLEVGTGFHPELTGRENIFLNGAILGMRKVEIRKKFDEIVAFAEVERFLDVPVKRFSSGMYMRLAFAVAAYLEPEILLVDEVLAVGDASFQKKCLGQMDRVARQDGRTVLFVSHNMAAVSSLCTKAIALQDGLVIFPLGDTTSAIQQYLSATVDVAKADLALRKDRYGEGKITIIDFGLYDRQGRRQDFVVSGQDVEFRLYYRCREKHRPQNIVAAVSIHSLRAGFVTMLTNQAASEPFASLGAEGFISCRVPRLPLGPGEYTVNVGIHQADVRQDWVGEAATISVQEGDFFGTGRLPPPERRGIFLDQTWSAESAPSVLDKREP